MTTISQKKLLYEVSIIRPTIIFLLVVLHSFTKIASGGGMTNDYQLAEPYQWFCWLISGFRIETIALIAGYVFAYQSIDLHRKYRFGSFVWKKIKRLIIPMLVFGLFYYFCFSYDSSVFGWKPFLVELFSGAGHLWFLPMLFWCFIAIWFIDRFKLSSLFTLFLLAIITLIPIPSIPFGFGRLPHFLFFVYAGYFLWEKRDWILKHCLNNVTIVAFWVVYIFLVIVKQLYVPTTNPEMTLIEKAIKYGLIGVVNLLMSCSGITALYLTVCNKTTQEGFCPKQWVIDASDVCYGVYVYHQFVLVFLYFLTPLVVICHPLLVPWIGLLVTLCVSYLLTKITLKTKIGRSLIG